MQILLLTLFYQGGNGGQRGYVNKQTTRAPQSAASYLESRKEGVRLDQSQFGSSRGQREVARFSPTHALHASCHVLLSQCIHPNSFVCSFVCSFIHSLICSCPSRPCVNATDSLAEPDPPSQLVPRIHSSLNSDFFASLLSQL